MEAVFVWWHSYCFAPARTDPYAQWCFMWDCEKRDPAEQGPRVSFVLVVTGGCLCERRKRLLFQTPPPSSEGLFWFMKSKDRCFSLGILGTAFHTFVPRTENVMTVLPFFIDTFCSLLMFSAYQIKGTDMRMSQHLLLNLRAQSSWDFPNSLSFLYRFYASECFQWEFTLAIKNPFDRRTEEGSQAFAARLSEQQYWQSHILQELSTFRRRAAHPPALLDWFCTISTSAEQSLRYRNALNPCRCSFFHFQQTNSYLFSRPM